MATFLITLAASFNVANYAVTKHHMDSKGGGTGDIENKLDKLISQSHTDKELGNEIAKVLINIHQGINDVKGLTTEQGNAILNLGKAFNNKR